MSASADVSTPGNPTMCVIRMSARPEPEALWHELLSALPTSEPVALDASAVEKIGTAALQLLFAFERDRRAADRAVIWQGRSRCFNEARTLLALESDASAIVGSGETCRDA